MANKQGNKAQTLFIGALALILVAIVCAVLCITLFTGHISSAVDAKQSVVQLSSMYTDPATLTPMVMSGTAFAIGVRGQNPEYFVTNYHVIEGVVLYGGSNTLTYSGATGDGVVPKIVKVNPEKDLAILQIPEPTNKRKPLVIRRQADVVPGESVYALGYPVVSIASSQYSPVNISDISMTRGIVSKKSTLAGTTIETYELDTALHGGNSGGPLVDESGRAIGVCAYASSYTETMNFAIQIDELMPMLRELEIAATLSTDGNILLYVLIGIGALALISGVIILLTYKKAPKGKAAPTGPATKVSPVLRGLNGKLAGQKFEFSGERIVLGRDRARCNIVFDADAPGISSAHCSIYYDQMNRQFILEDLGSSYGTFRSNGQKLAQGIPITLVSGDSFYLANTSCSFAVGLE